MAKKVKDASAAAQSTIEPSASGPQAGLDGPRPSNFAVTETYASIAGMVYGVMNMDDEQIQELERLGDGIRDVMWALKSARKGRGEAAPVLAEEKPEPKKTRIADCRACWCDDCANIETCERHLDGETPDGIIPAPCARCKDGMRFKPKEREPGCEYREGDGQNHG